jgi:hypothetical protein
MRLKGGSANLIFLKILIIIGIIIASLILLLLILLSFKSKLILKYEKNFVVQFRYLFLTIQFYPTKAQKKEKKIKKLKNKKDSEKSTAVKPQERKKDDSGVKDTEDITIEKKGFFNKFFSNLSFWDYIDIWGIIFDKFFNKIYCEELNVNAVIASEDAAETALNYGRLNAAVYPMAGSFYNSDKVKNLSINIKPDFSKKDSSFEGSLIISARFIYAILCIIYIIKKFI